MRALAFQRKICHTLHYRLVEPRRFIQVLSGPRQVGKTTLARQVMSHLKFPSHYASADQPTLQGGTWLEQQWEIGRLRARGDQKEALLILDEIHKVTGWSEIVKRLWDEDTAQKRLLKVVLLGSSPLLVQTGLTESLAGRFEIIPVPHWSFGEMREAFGWDLDHYLYFGGYPGTAELVGDQERWSRYLHDSLIETTISRDILLLTRVDKPALLRRLFHLGSEYSGQVLSYQKMLGQLQDAGNTTTLAHYLELLAGCGLLSGLPKFAGQRHRQRASSPKLQVWNTALATALSPHTFESAQQDRNFWGRLVESAVGAHLLNTIRGTKTEIFYWRERNQEVDFVLRSGKEVVALEVKSNRRREAVIGLETFAKIFHPCRKILVGEQGVKLEEFLLHPATEWMKH